MDDLLNKFNGRRISTSFICIYDLFFLYLQRKAIFYN